MKYGYSFLLSATPGLKFIRRVEVGAEWSTSFEGLELGSNLIVSSGRTDRDLLVPDCRSRTPIPWTVISVRYCMQNQFGNCMPCKCRIWTRIGPRRRWPSNSDGSEIIKTIFEFALTAQFLSLLVHVRKILRHLVVERLNPGCLCYEVVFYSTRALRQALGIRSWCCLGLLRITVLNLARYGKKGIQMMSLSQTTYSDTYWFTTSQPWDIVRGIRPFFLGLNKGWEFFRYGLGDIVKRQVCRHSDEPFRLQYKSV